MRRRAPHQIPIRGQGSHSISLKGFGDLEETKIKDLAYQKGY